MLKSRFRCFNQTFFSEDSNNKHVGNLLLFTTATGTPYSQFPLKPAGSSQVGQQGWWWWWR